MQTKLEALAQRLYGWSRGKRITPVRGTKWYACGKFMQTITEHEIVAMLRAGLAQGTVDGGFFIVRPPNATELVRAHRRASRET